VDGTKLKVFKYTLAGSLLGSWAIDPTDAHPTGITIDPNHVSDIWIVDDGTDKVYQYVGAASRTSGSQNAAATFALAAGDTNPQGIADPPTGAPLPVTSSHDAVFAELGSGAPAVIQHRAIVAKQVDWPTRADATALALWLDLPCGDTADTAHHKR
jgi:hypothetical protein